MAACSPTGRQCRTGGFAYVLLLTAVAIMAMAVSASVSFGIAFSRRSAEQELLAIGMAFQAALSTYAGAPQGTTAGPGSRGPRELQELLKDERVVGIRRHLRQVPHDPLTGRAEWGLVRDSQGFIVGVYSLAPGRPLQRTGFDMRIASFEGADSYSEWVFGFAAALPRASRAAAAIAPPPAQ